MTLQLNSSIQYVPRVGPMIAGKLERLGIHTVRDLLFYAPFRYNDFSKITPIRSLHPGLVVSIHGEVQSIKNIFTKTGKKIQECQVADPTGIATIIWFNQLYLTKVIHAGDILAASGTVGFFGNKLVLESPDYELATPGKPFLHTSQIVPVYSETAGITSKWLRSRIYYLLTEVPTLLEEYIPSDIRIKYKLPHIQEAFHDVHFPKTITLGVEARRRLAFDELLLMQCTSFEQKRLWKETKHTVPLISNIDQCISNLPFTLTDSQMHALADIQTDMASTVPMNRLLEGDVGSGKTVVAAIAMYITAKNNLQSILMAPTQILAEQHFNTIKQLLKPFNISVGLVTSSHKEPDVMVLVGTHALLEKNIEFDHVGLVVIDEQQRFGVFQRNIVRTKGKGTTTPHLLTMTATPIPRTLALTLYGNLDLSILTDMPKGRKNIKTWVVPPEKRDSAYEWMKQEMQVNSSQCFIICPFIEESESMTTIKAATTEFKRLSTSVFPKLKLGLLHGRLKAKDKIAILDAFRRGDIDILVATPVVEVGIDIPNATIMLVEGSDRFGLAQLHQLRGRVGRSDKQSYCLLFSENTNQDSIKRLKALETMRSGTELAEYDLALRGQGDVFGARQHGVPTLVLGSLSDATLVSQTKEAVTQLTHIDPTFTAFPLLRERLNESKIENVSQD
ncbi:MAG: ATP-dependent DNA helicase RecG [Microgenomates group bacterium GW2011_GWB1_40_9]|nr:MAG: ATP-dependent DNA helicase RecG [Microgenomates group bacterium GW2011_GWB1_40_9]